MVKACDFFLAFLNVFKVQMCDKRFFLGEAVEDPAFHLFYFLHTDGDVLAPCLSLLYFWPPFVFVTLKKKTEIQTFLRSVQPFYLRFA